MTGPLNRVKIVELAQMITVPGATNLLANQGAEIGYSNDVIDELKSTGVIS